MNDQAASPVPMTPYVLITVAVTVVAALAAAALVYWFDVELGGSAGNIVTMIGIIAGVGMFGRSINRPMSRPERLRFATSVMLVNLILPILVVVGILTYVGIALDMEGVNLLLSGGESTDLLSPAVLVAIFGFAGLLTFGEAFVFGWIMTRKLPRQSSGSD